MSERYEPVRWWADTDQCSVFCDMPDVVEEDAPLHVIPKGHDGRAWDCDGVQDWVEVPEIPQIIGWLQSWAASIGPLRSLRVLLSTGHEVQLRGTWMATMENDTAWRWRLSRDNGLAETGGNFNTRVDAEAVSRALSEARRWLEEQEVAGQ